MNPYTVLKVSQDSSLKEVRNAYKKALLSNHPDKNKGPCLYTIDEVNVAYTTIVDSHTNSSQSNRTFLDVQFSDVRDLAEFEFDDNSQQFARPCRCGQNIIISIDELEANGDADEIAVQCSGCSLWVLVQYEIET